MSSIHEESVQKCGCNNCNQDVYYYKITDPKLCNITRKHSIKVTSKEKEFTFEGRTIYCRVFLLLPQILNYWLIVKIPVAILIY